VRADHWPEGSLPLIEMVEAAGVEQQGDIENRQLADF